MKVRRGLAAAGKASGGSSIAMATLLTPVEVKW